ncbi:hypothetical protein AOL_s00004g39 [Orbilia oligospora ATCC 24927]|uniref:Uncharacterized protein n=1 Tax=Arthrobotrys oligospora (strain ATCC 24927 / CBS 115.81 / DSM 1491) TaxID=756982 RepID=G1WXM9_ARTOA|nr:hypothetical protein AOL_s00004g39 [Orbilia oligospora ATCC 24927]EGX54006.1 hypothetical protein AOL_s00004g39 [Orbilia oligospora ATCC 24927]
MPRCNKLPTAEIQASVSTLCLDAFNRYKVAKAAGVLNETELNTLYNEFMTLSSEMNMLTLQVSGLRSKSPKEERPKAQLWLV